MTDIQKVQYQSGAVKIWVMAHQDAKDTSNFDGIELNMKCSSKDEPRKEFKAAFEALQDVAVQAMMAVDSWSDCDLTVHTVNFIEKDGELHGAQFGGVIWITEDSRMNFKTPVSCFKKDKEDDNDFVVLAPKSVKIVKSMLKEVELYYAGERAQAEMVLEGKAA